MSVPVLGRNTLTGWRVAVTRASDRGRGLCEAIEAAGGRALNMPVIEIAPCPDPGKARGMLAHLPEVSIAIFTSAPAVTHTLDLLGEVPWPDSIVTLAVGPSTRERLKGRGISSLIPVAEFSSEGLLDLPQLAEVTGQRILIPGAPAGREALSRELTARGARVLSPMVYRRIPASATAEPLQQALASNAPLLLLATSATIVEYLLLLAGARAGLLRNCPLVAASRRIADVARNLGMPRVVTAGGADDEAMLTGIGEAVGRFAPVPAAHDNASPLTYDPES